MKLKDLPLQASEIEKILIWFAKQSRIVQTKCLDEKSLFRLILQAARLYEKTNMRAQRWSRELSELDETEEIKLENFLHERRKKQRTGQKATLLMKNRAFIHRYRNKGMSWREIADYLSKKKGVKITAPYLYKIYKNRIEPFYIEKDSKLKK